MICHQNENLSEYKPIQKKKTDTSIFVDLSHIKFALTVRGGKKVQNILTIYSTTLVNTDTFHNFLTENKFMGDNQSPKSTKNTSLDTKE